MAKLWELDMNSHVGRGCLLAGILVIAMSISCSGKRDPERESVDQKTVGATAEETVKEIEPFSFGDPDTLPVDQGDTRSPQIITASGATTLGSVIDSEIDEIGRQLGDAKVVLEYVAREIAYEPYVGVLRGAVGTYLAKSGNSIDRALFLAKLLHAADQSVEVRFAHCNSVDPRVLATRNRDIAGRELDKAISISTDPDENPAKHWYEEALSKARFEASQTESQLTAALEPVLKPILASRADVGRSENKHFWLQLHHEGTWVDMDPVTESGAPVCSPMGVQAEISSDFFHRIALSVVVETLKGGMLSESVVLGVERTAAEFAASRILFTFGEPSELVQPVDDIDSGLASYTPVLRIDGENFVGTAISLPRLSSLEGPQDVGGGFADVLGADFYGGVEQSSIPDEEVMSAWIQLDISAPNRTDVSARSEIFDRLGTGVRLQGSSSGFELLPLLVVDGEYAATSSFWEVGIVLGEMAAPDLLLDDSIDVTTVDGLSAILDGVARMFPTVRRQLGGSPASPMVLMLGVVPADDTSDSATTQIVFDALHVASAIPNDARSASRDAVSSPFAEYLLASSAGNRMNELDDVAHVMRSARASSIPLVTIGASDQLKIEGASLAAAMRMKSRIRQGHVVITPARAPATPSGVTKTAWWYVDPALGVVGDEHENGRSTATGEYIAPKMKKPSLMARVKRFACAVAIPFVVATSAIHSANPSQESAKIIKAIRRAGSDTERRRRLEETFRISCGTNKNIRNTPPGPSP